MINTDDRIKSKRKEYKYTQRSLAKALGITSTTVSQWERGLTKPIGKNLVKLAKVFKTSPDWIMDGKSDIDNSNYKLSTLIPYLKDINKFEVISTKYLKQKEFEYIFAYEMEGDSMTPEIKNRSVVICDISQKKIIDGQKYIFKHGEITRVKQLTITPKGINLISLNSNYQTELISPNELTIIGNIFLVLNQI